MRIGYFGDGPWAHNAFNKIISDDSFEIAFVMPRFDNRDPVLMGLAKDNNIPIEICKNVNSEEFLESIKKYNVDIFVSMSFNQIFKAETINFPPLKTINCHAGKLPFYRGRNILNWALINDEKEYGITVHYMDEGIDTGDIILQRTYPIDDNDSYATLLNRAHTDCADILYDALKMIRDDKVKVIKQDTIDAFCMYCGMRGPGDEIVNWKQNSRAIFNFVRAICKPGPQATSFINGKEIKINKVKYIPDAPEYINTPGQIIGKTSNGFYVKTLDTVVEVVEYSYDGKIRVGDRMKDE